MSDPSTNPDYSLRILWSLARWLEDVKGSDVLAAVAASAGVSASDFDGSTRWVSHAQLEIILAAAQELAGDEATFRAALAHRYAEGYGAFRHMVWAVSVERQSQLAIHMANKVLSNVGRFEMLYSTRTSIGSRYTSERAESRALCISRQVGWTTAPLLRGLPAAELVERSCIANGDSCCEYHVKWVDERSLLPALVGLVAGIAGAFVLALVEPSIASAVAFPLLGLGAGHLHEVRRVASSHLEHAKDVGEALRVLGETEAETRSEILAMQQRQQEWSSLMEQEANERNATLEKVVEGLDGLQQSRVTSLRGFSHDLRNPLFVVRGNMQLLLDRFPDGENGEILQDIDAASLQIEAMLSRLMEVATAEGGRTKLAPREMKVAPLATTLRRRLKALVHARSIEVDVVCTPDAPAAIVVDALVFDRVIDNLLTNAAKYTDRGSIRLVIGSARGRSDAESPCLTLSLSDTGRGIPRAQLATIFKPRSADAPRSKESYGVGLSSAVRLLEEIGGRLEVSSKAGVGSTFVAYFPEAQARQVPAPSVDQSFDAVISRVVTLRQAS